MFLTFNEAIVNGTSSPRISLMKILLNDRSMIRESSIAFATNCPITRRMWVRFLGRGLARRKEEKKVLLTVHHHSRYLRDQWVTDRGRWGGRRIGQNL